MAGQKTIPLIATPDMVSFADRVYARLPHDRFTRQDLELVRFANGEYKPRVAKNVRDRDVYLFHSLHPDPNTTYMQMFLINDAIARADARSVNLVLPYLPYLRQDRKDEPRTPISASLLAAMTEMVQSVKRIVTIDMHAESEEGFYRRICVDHLQGKSVFAKHFREQYAGDFSRVVVVAPDAGGVKRARKFAAQLSANVPTYSIDKRRTGPNEAEVMYFVGDAENVRDKDVILFDDMIDSGGSTVSAVRKLRELRPRGIAMCATHGIFSAKGGPAETKMRKAGVPVLTTESIPRPDEYRAQHSDWLTILPLDDLIAASIDRLSSGESLSELLEEWK